MPDKRYVEVNEVAYRMLVRMERYYRKMGFPDTVVSVTHDAIKYRYDFLVDARLIARQRKQLAAPAVRKGKGK